MFQLIVGVGNPGSEYANTKHNIAWLLLDQHPDFKNLVWKSKFKGLYAETNLEGQKICLLKPQTYMNLSGESVQPFTNFFKIPLEKILVIHDELDLPFGQVHFKLGGGFAGHNGLKSIAGTLGSDSFARMRIGIGRPVHGTVADWVLSPFSKEQQTVLPMLLEKLNAPLVECVVNGLTKVSTQYNKKTLI